MVVRFIAILSMVRWYNILALIVAMLLFSVFVLNDATEWVRVVLDWKLFWLITGFALIIMSGYIINAFYDVEKDLVNNAKTTIFGRHVSRAMSFRIYFAFNMLGVLMGALVDWKLMLFQSMFIFLLWLYSHKLRKIPVIGEMSASLLLLVPFGCLAAYYNGFSSHVLLYMGFIFTIDFTREIVKKLEALRGDIVYSYGSIATALGETRTKWVVVGIMSITLSLMYFLHPIVEKNTMAMVFLLVVGICILAALALLMKSNLPKDYARVHFIYKAIIVLTIACIVFL